MINRLFILNASKKTISILLCYFIALSLNWPFPAWSVFSALFVQTAFIGATINKSILRITATVVGSFIGLVFLSFFAQSRELYIFFSALWIAYCTYEAGKPNQNYAYVFLFAGITAYIISLESIVQVNTFYNIAIYRILETCLGVIVVLTIDNLFWPNVAGNEFKRELLRCYGEIKKLLILITDSYEQQIGVTQEQTEHRRQLYYDIQNLRVLKNYSRMDDHDVQRNLNFYDQFIDELERLFSVVYAWQLSLLEVKPHFKDFNKCICQSARTLIIAMDQTEKRWQEKDYAHIEVPDESILSSLIERTGDFLETKEYLEYKPLEVTLLFAVKTKLVDIVNRMKEFNQLLIEFPKIKKKTFYTNNKFWLTEFFVDKKDIFNLKSWRTKLAIKAGILSAVASVLWIMTNWPGNFLGVLLITVFSMLNVFVPNFCAKQIGLGFLFGAIAASFTFFISMPLCSEFVTLAFLLAPFFFVFSYIMNYMETNMLGLCSNLSFIILIDIGNPQMYNTISFLNNMLGLLLSALIVTIGLRLFWRKIPEHEFSKECAKFFDQTAEMIELFGDPQDFTPLRQQYLFNLESRLSKQPVKIMELLNKIVRHRMTEDDKHKMLVLLRSMHGIAFRLESLEYHRMIDIDYNCYQALLPPLIELRQTLIKALKTWATQLRTSKQIGEVLEVENFRLIFSTIETLSLFFRSLDQENKLLDRNNRIKIASRIGFYQNVVHAVFECKDRLQQVDWIKLQENYF